MEDGAANIFFPSVIKMFIVPQKKNSKKKIKALKQIIVIVASVIGQFFLRAAPTVIIVLFPFHPHKSCNENILRPSIDRSGAFCLRGSLPLSDKLIIQTGKRVQSLAQFSWLNSWLHCCFILGSLANVV